MKQCVFTCGTCLIDFLNEIYEGVDAGDAREVVVLDLAKAFDTLDHDVLFVKLRHLGFKVSSINWVISYLTNRVQTTKVGKTLSDWKQIYCGVPQGSILGPLLFICYINDLPYHISIGRPLLYADDTAIIFRNNNIRQMEQDRITDLEKLHNWFSVKKLSVNIDKTKVMIFTHPRGVLKYATLNITLDNP